jgi:hypothetical protein
MSKFLWVDADYCQFSDRGFIKRTQIWGSLPGLPRVLCIPEISNDTQLLLHLYGKQFDGFITPIGITRVETLSQLTAEKVAEQMVEWLKDR